MVRRPSSNETHAFVMPIWMGLLCPTSCANTKSPLNVFIKFSATTDTYVDLNDPMVCIGRHTGSRALPRLIDGHLTEKLTSDGVFDPHTFNSMVQKNKSPLEDDLLPWTVSEIRRLLSRLVWKVAHSLDHVLAWSVWRRRHQARAKRCHYRRRHSLLPSYLRL